MQRLVTLWVSVVALATPGSAESFGEARGFRADSGAVARGNGGSRPCSPEGWCWFAPSLPSDPLYGTWGVSSDDFWTVGPGDYLLHWDGSQLTAMYRAETLSGIWGASQEDIWAVGSDILHWDGARWTIAFHVDRGLLGRVWGSSAADIGAVGTEGRILRSNGRVWNDFPSPTTQYLVALASTGPEDVWIAGSLGALFHWDVGKRLRQRLGRRKSRRPSLGRCELELALERRRISVRDFRNLGSQERCLVCWRTRRGESEKIKRNGSTLSVRRRGTYLLGLGEQSGRRLVFR